MPPPEPAPYRVPAYHVMVKPRGAICNLDCHYCYYLEKEELYPGSAFRMSDEVLEAFIEQYMGSQPVPEVVFAWQGGEPTLMGLDFFRRAVSFQAQHRRPGMRVVNAFQTNGLLLDDDWCRFFRANDFLIGISVDGPAALHDAYRVDKGGKPTHDRVMAGLDLLKRHGVAFNVLTTVHAANADHPLDVYRFLRDEVGTDFIQFIPIVERRGARPEHPGAGAPSVAGAANEAGGPGRPAGPAVAVGGPGSAATAATDRGGFSPVTDRSVTGAGYGRFLNAIFDEWVRRDVGRVFVQIFDVALAAWAGHRPGLCIFEETCGEALALEHDGDLYACDHFVRPEHRLGNIRRTPLPVLVAGDQQRAFGRAKRDDLPAYCRACDVRFVCNGGCPKNRLISTPDGEPGLNWLCEGYQLFFRHIAPHMEWMVEALQERRPPAGIMEALGEGRFAPGGGGGDS